MTAHIAILPDRGLLRLSGPDTDDFLHRLITSELPADETALLPSALLTPQGKVQFAFLLTRTADGYLLDCAAGRTGVLIKRLKLFRLRAKVDIDDLSADHEVAVCWNGAPDDAVRDQALAAVRDPRGGAEGHDLGWRLYAGQGTVAGNADAADWHRLRQLAAVAEEGREFSEGEVFPTDINLDRLGGVSYTKGCFVGQEVVSRMHHRGSERRRTVVVRGADDLGAPGASLDAGERSVGKVIGSSGETGIALVRIDRLAAALVTDEPLTAAGVAVTAEWPDWLGPPAELAEKSKAEA